MRSFMVKESSSASSLKLWDDSLGHVLEFEGLGEPTLEVGAGGVKFGDSDTEMYGVAGADTPRECGYTQSVPLCTQ
jgi:hypothetical protein